MWSCIGYDPENVVIHAEDKYRAYQYFYPISLLEQHCTLIPPKSATAYVPPAYSLDLPSVSKIFRYDEYWAQSSHFVRQWWPTLPDTSIRRCSCTIILFARREGENAVKFTLGQHYFSIPLQASQLHRWFVPEPFEIVCIQTAIPERPEDRRSLAPLIAVDFGHAVWLEYTSEGEQDKRVRFATFPPVSVDRESKEFGTASGQVRTLEMPTECDLNKVCHIGIDQAHGCVILGLGAGQIFIMKYQ